MRTYLSLFLGILLLMSCDPIKRSIRRQERIDNLVADYLVRNPIKTDTVYVEGETVYRSDTIVNENIYVDTVKAMDTVWVHQTKFRDLVKTFYRTDTVFTKFIQTTGVPLEQYMLMTENAKIAKKRSNQYLGWFLIACSLIVLYVLYRLFE